MPDKYAVMGNPIAHSKSPLIHRLFAQQTQQNIEYIAIEVPIHKFKNYVDDFVQQGGKGLNITLPFKQEAVNAVTQLSERAKIAAAINTIKIDDNHHLFGDNTDGVGLLKDLTDNHRVQLTNKRILIIGAGGAVRGVLEPLLNQKPKSINIANRTANTAQALAQQFSSYGEVIGMGFDEIEKSYDIIINGTSIGLDGKKVHLPEQLIASNTFYYDMMYGKSTPFLTWLITHGVTNFSDGIGMLVEQAAESFYIWRNIRPDTTSVLQYLRNEIVNQ